MAKPKHLRRGMEIKEREGERNKHRYQRAIRGRRRPFLGGASGKRGAPLQSRQSCLGPVRARSRSSRGGWE